MACKLTYEGKRFDNRQRLIKHLELKGVLDQLMITNLASKQGIEDDVRYQMRQEYEQQKLSAIRKVNEVGLKITVKVKEDINECSWIS